MAFGEPSIDDVEQRAAVARATLSSSLADISDRLKPANIVASAKAEITHKASALAGGLGETVRKHGGEAALFGAGAMLAFDMGRRTMRRRNAPSAAETMADDVDSGSDYRGSATWPSSTPARRNGVNAVRGTVDTMRTWVTPMAGAVLGYAVASALPKTRLEAEAFGTMGKEFRSAVDAFRREHAQGAKQAAAEVFGIAKYSAAALGLMAAVGQCFSAPATPDDRADPAERAANPSAHYDMPDDVVRDPGMSPDQCAKALDQLELDARLLQTAEDEGMGGGEPARIAEVAETKAKVGAPPLPKPV